MKRIAFTAVLAAIMFQAVSCDQISIDEIESSAPLVESFSPASAPAGAIVTVTGQYLNNVTEAYIGTAKVEITEKVSPTRLSIRVPQGISGGKIKLVNPEGEGVSADSFTCTFAVPSIKTTLLQKEAELGSNVLLSGTDMGVVSAVLFTADGYTQGHEATILYASEDEIVVKVPYVEAEDVKITLGYFNGTANVFTPLESAPLIKVIRRVPTFDAYTLEKTAVGKSITLTGSYLNNIDKVMVGEFEAQLFKEPSKLTFTIPAGNFEDGETVVELKAYYFDLNENIVLAPAFVVYVPFVKYWENIQTWAQGRVAENSYASFFSPETGILYANADWKTVLDPVAMKYNNSQWESANAPKPGVVSDEEYDSVVPYFFISAVSGNVLQINSPANSNGQLKNFFVDATSTPSNDFRVPGGNISLPGTPILGFRYLSPASSNEAETALVAKVLAGQVDNINEELFPIDVTANTIAGISVSSIAGGIKSDKWCDHQTATMVDEKDYKLDAVFLVAYYSNCGYSKEAPAQNIKRLGILHITSIDWGIYNNSNYGASKITFNFHWQKYDYDYNKL